MALGEHLRMCLFAHWHVESAARASGQQQQQLSLARQQVTERTKK